MNNPVNLDPSLYWGNSWIYPADKSSECPTAKDIGKVIAVATACFLSVVIAQKTPTIFYLSTFGGVIYGFAAIVYNRTEAASIQKVFTIALGIIGVAGAGVTSTLFISSSSTITAAIIAKNAPSFFQGMTILTATAGYIMPMAYTALKHAVHLQSDKDCSVGKHLSQLFKGHQVAIQLLAILYTLFPQLPLFSTISLAMGSDIAIKNQFNKIEQSWKDLEIALQDYRLITRILATIPWAIACRALFLSLPEDCYPKYGNEIITLLKQVLGNDEHENFDFVKIFPHLSSYLQRRFKEEYASTPRSLERFEKQLKVPYERLKKIENIIPKNLSNESQANCQKWLKELKEIGSYCAKFSQETQRIYKMHTFLKILAKKALAEINEASDFQALLKDQDYLTTKKEVLHLANGHLLEGSSWEYKDMNKILQKLLSRVQSVQEDQEEDVLAILGSVGGFHLKDYKDLGDWLGLDKDKLHDIEPALSAIRLSTAQDFRNAGIFPGKKEKLQNHKEEIKEKLQAYIKKNKPLVQIHPQSMPTDLPQTNNNDSIETQVARVAYRISVIAMSVLPFICAPKLAGCGIILGSSLSVWVELTNAKDRFDQLTALFIQVTERIRTIQMDGPFRLLHTPLLFCFEIAEVPFDRAFIVIGPQSQQRMETFAHASLIERIRLLAFESLCTMKILKTLAISPFYQGFLTGFLGTRRIIRQAADSIIRRYYPHISENAAV